MIGGWAWACACVTEVQRLISFLGVVIIIIMLCKNKICKSH